MKTGSLTRRQGEYFESPLAEPPNSNADKTELRQDGGWFQQLQWFIRETKMTKKLDLHIEDLEERIAPNLLLPSGQNIFGGGNLPNGEPHPGFDPTTGRFGPWNAHFNADPIDCTECP